MISSPCILGATESSKCAVRNTKQGGVLPFKQPVTPGSTPESDHSNLCLRHFHRGYSTYGLAWLPAGTDSTTTSQVRSWRAVPGCRPTSSCPLRAPVSPGIRSLATRSAPAACGARSAASTHPNPMPSSLSLAARWYGTHAKPCATPGEPPSALTTLALIPQPRQRAVIICANVTDST
jgi:hypothetical protein